MQGEYHLSQNKLIFSNSAQSPNCPDQEGIYVWAGEQDQLKLVKVTDPCYERTLVLSNALTLLSL